MKGWVLLAGAGLLAAGPTAQPGGERLEGWLHNPRERTAAALREARENHPEEAAAHAETAHRLAPENPLTGYNAGTLELAAGDPARARALFEETLRGPGGGPAPKLPPELAAQLHYNLGNARLAGGDPAAAVEAYEETLRRDPGHQDAKFNLELALRELERQSASNPSPDPGAEGEAPREPQSSGGGSTEDPQSEQTRPPEETSPGGSESEEPSPEQETPAPRPPGSELRDFHDQPDMSATEAAAILEAVENLERQQRREAALQRARETAKGGKDW